MSCLTAIAYSICENKSHKLHASHTPKHLCGLQNLWQKKIKPC